MCLHHRVVRHTPSHNVQRLVGWRRAAQAALSDVISCPLRTKGLVAVHSQCTLQAKPVIVGEAAGERGCSQGGRREGRGEEVRKWRRSPQPGHHDSRPRRVSLPKPRSDPATPSMSSAATSTPISRGNPTPACHLHPRLTCFHAAHVWALWLARSPRLDSIPRPHSRGGPSRGRQPAGWAAGDTCPLWSRP